MALHYISSLPSKFTKNICRAICLNRTSLISTTRSSKIDQSSKYASNNADGHCRSYSRRSWFKSKKSSYDIVDLCEVGPLRAVPDYIPKPSYSSTGIEDEPKDHIEILQADNVQRMRQSCSLAKIVLDEVSRHITVGITTDDLDAIAHNACINFGVYPSPLNYRGFPKSICTSVNNIACHGIPDSRILKNGDIISVDISVFYNGFHGDCASTYFVGDVDPRAQKLVEVANLCLQEGIKTCHPDQNFCTIGKAISNLAKSHGFSVIPAFCGHGISSCFHCLPNILHYGYVHGWKNWKSMDVLSRSAPSEENEEPGQMQKGMIFTIEPVICEGRPDILILEDGWTAATEDNSRSAQFEHTILITDDGAEVLTVPDNFKSRNLL